MCISGPPPISTSKGTGARLLVTWPLHPSPVLLRQPLPREQPRDIKGSKPGQNFNSSPRNYSGSPRAKPRLGLTEHTAGALWTENAPEHACGLRAWGLQVAVQARVVQGAGPSQARINPDKAAS